MRAELAGWRANSQPTARPGAVGGLLCTPPPAVSAAELARISQDATSPGEHDPCRYRERLASFRSCRSRGSATEYSSRFVGSPAPSLGDQHKVPVPRSPCSPKLVDRAVAFGCRLAEYGSVRWIVSVKLSEPVSGSAIFSTARRTKN